MAIVHRVFLSRAAKRFMLAAGTAALMAGCSDASRFSSDPFGDPFGSPTLSSPRPPRSVDRAPTGAISDSQSSAPIQSRPLAPPARSAPAQSAAPRALSQPQAAAPAGAYNHWSADGGTPITVSEGDTAGILANRYGVPTDALLRVNGYSSAQQVQPGTRLVIPVYRATAVAAPKPVAPVYAAKEESAEKPVRRAEAKPAPVVKAAKPQKLAKLEASHDDAPVLRTPAGKRAELPASRAAHVAKVNKREEEEKPAAAGAKPVKPRLAAKPDDLSGDKAAAKAKVRTAKLEKDDADHKPGAASKAKPAKIHSASAAEEAPEVKPGAKVKPVRVAKAEPVEAPKVQEKREPIRTASAAAPVVEPAKVDKTTTTSSVAPAEEAKSADPAHPEFRWPARGRIIQGFASGGNEGINIAVPEGTAVKAAEGGTVVYAGSELKGYGNLVLIKHPNGFVSAYAHNGEVSVKRGDRVTRGQSIAKSGQSGNVASPQLHFELRKGSQPVDPTNYLAGL
jgi:murein DD-endopeptidase MepM/ murein hydrolase activator NlpD